MKHLKISLPIVRFSCFLLFLTTALIGCKKEPNYPAFTVQSRCANGIQDPDEYGVDCGGPCLNSCENTRYLEGEIFRRMSLDIRYNYILTGPLVIRDGGSLELPSGTQLRVRAGVGAYIAVTQGGSLFAWGTQDQPITISSIAPNPQAGDWGGVIICGLAPLEDNSTKRSPLGDYFYGGNLPNDTSGYLRYLKIEHAGAEQEEADQFNALSLYGVGRYTQIDHVWVDGAAHHGIGIDGGTVPLEHVVVSQSGENGMDIRSNWQGQGEAWHLRDNESIGLRIDDVETTTNYTSSFTINTLALIDNVSKGVELNLEQTQASFSNIYIQGSPLGMSFNPQELPESGLQLNAVFLTGNAVLSNSPSFNAQHQNTAQPPFANPSGTPAWLSAWNSF